ncbi:hypothetical protein [Effusibacillus pohliae]|uniref:hypothetical protein n=1 Tax=Effusibacillus pohliae TaxID=232270 RepID=UPI00035DEB15|nr:hypothetical protein [Effusibacillus pohliae]
MSNLSILFKKIVIGQIVFLVLSICFCIYLYCSFHLVRNIELELEKEKVERMF